MGLIPGWGAVLSHTLYKTSTKGKSLTEKTHQVQKRLPGLVKHKRHETNKIPDVRNFKKTEITTNAAEIKQTLTGNFKQDYTNPPAVGKRLMADYTYKPQRCKGQSRKRIRRTSQELP